MQRREVITPFHACLHLYCEYYAVCFLSFSKETKYRVAGQAKIISYLFILKELLVALESVRIFYISKL